MNRVERFNKQPTDNIYLLLKEKRNQKRLDYIKRGLLLDSQASLQQAIQFKGTCTDMCPEYERYEREYQKSIDPLELVFII